MTVGGTEITVRFHQSKIYKSTTEVLRRTFISKHSNWPRLWSRQCMPISWMCTELQPPPPLQKKTNPPSQRLSHHVSVLLSVGFCSGHHNCFNSHHLNHLLVSVSHCINDMTTSGVFSESCFCIIKNTSFCKHSLWTLFTYNVPEDCSQFNFSPMHCSLRDGTTFSPSCCISNW